MTTDIGSKSRFRLRSDREDPRLLKPIGSFSGVSALLAVIIGAGIVSVPQRAAQYLSNIPLILGLWAAVGIVCLVGGLIWAELGTRMPFSGGDYQYLARAYGPGFGFLYGWKSLLLSGPQNRAALAIVTADYLGAFVPLSTNAHLMVAITAVLLTGAVNYIGVVWAARFQSLSAIVKVVGLLALVIAGLLIAPVVAPASSDLTTEPVSASRFPAVVLLIFFSYTGWARLGYMTGEMKNPQRDLPRTMGIGMIGALLIYLLVNWLCFRTLGLEGVRASEAVLSDVASRFMGEGGARLVAGLIVVSVTGSMSVSILSHSRLYFSMAKDGLFFRFLDCVHPVFHTPHRSVVLHVALSILALVLVRDFAALATSAVFLNSAFFILKAHTLFRLRRKRVGEDGSYRVPFYPWLPLLFVVPLYAVCIGRLILDWQRAGIDVILLLSGVPAYLLWRRWSRG